MQRMHAQDIRKMQETLGDDIKEGPDSALPQSDWQPTSTSTSTIKKQLLTTPATTMMPTSSSGAGASSDNVLDTVASLDLRVCASSFFLLKVPSPWQKLPFY